MRAWVRTDRLTGLNLTTGDIIKAIEAQNVQAAAGRIGARPISNDQQLQLNIQTKGRLDSVKDFEKIVVRTNPDGSVLRLGDVARLELGASSLDRQTRFNGGLFFQSIREKVRPSTRPPAAPALPMPDAPPEVSAGKREG